jgi:choline dehydrogenase
VGQGLQDHLAITKYFSTSERTLNTDLGNIFGKVIAGIKYILTKSGPLSIPVNQTSGFVRSDIKSVVPDLQVYANPIAYSTDQHGRTYVNSKSGFLISVQPSRSTSRGSVNIQSPNVKVSPLINANSLNTKDDQLMAIKAGRMIQQIANTKAIKSVTKKAFDVNFMNLDDEGLLNSFREFASTVYHPCCTCRMGRSINNSVINNKLQIHGLKNIRVVDASSFPNITSGNINAPTMMLAYRAAEIILEDNV